jgi:hypothetical protein
MVESKLSNSELSRLRRSMGLRELAMPATLRTRTTTGILWPRPSEAALREHGQRGEEHVTQLQRILHMRRGAPVLAGTPQPKQNPQEPSKVEPAATVAVPVMEPLSRRRPDYRDPPECIAKPWKKPWDK